MRALGCNYDHHVKVAASIALTLASVALALYVAAITIRVDELNPQPAVLWPYDWLWWVVIPGGLLYLAGFTALVAGHRAELPAPSHPEPQPVRRATASIGTPWTSHDGMRSHRNIRNGNRTVEWAQNGATAGTLRPGVRGGFDAFDDADNLLGWVPDEKSGMELIKRHAR